ncbi:PepSY-associated TM helix domain-containing protein [Phenylobacterium sp.]|uniref:PepSY-associated TM helix domain-containing protein n=1 Tax=Phenylobacterium sp. TaxID=1871053 RepID=UPI002F3F05A6
MTRSPFGRLRRLWLDVHLWIGAGLLVVLAPLSLSGAILVWREPLDRALHPERFAVSGPEAALPLSAYADAAGAAFAGRAALAQLRLPQKAGDPVVATGRLSGPPDAGGRPRSLTVWLDPPTARVLGRADLSQSFSQVMHRLHGTLLIPQVGRKVVGWLGWAMFASCATGLWLWWPRGGGFLKALRWRRGSSKLFKLHHMVGFWICIPLAVLSLTGVYISFPQTARALFGLAEPRGGAPGGGAGRFAPPIPHPHLFIDRAGALALRPGARLVSISVPVVGKAPAWRLQVTTPDAEAPAAVQVADADGAVKGGRSGQGGPDPLSRLMRRIHDGTDTGPAWRTVIALGGLAPTVLALSGVVMWLRRRARRNALGGSA